MADESTVIQDTDSDDSMDGLGDVSLDSFNAVETKEDPEPSPVEDKTTEEAEGETTDTQEAAEDDTKPEEEESPDTESESDSEPDLKSMTRRERAEYFNQERQLQQEKRQVEQSIEQAYQPQDAQQLKEHFLSEGYSEAEATLLARDEVREQKATIAEAKAQIAEFNADLRVDTIEAQSKYDWMNPAKPDVYNKELHNYAADLFAQGIILDERTGNIIDAKRTPSQVADIVNKIYESGVQKATVKAQRAAEQQMASVAPPSSTRQPSRQGNSLKDMEDRLKDITF